MAGCSEKVPIALARPDDLQQFMPPAYTAVAVKPAATSRLLKTGIVVLIAGAILLLFGAIGAFYFWNNNDNYGITGVRFAGGEKCYIKTQVKAHLPDVKTLNKDSLLFDLEDEVMPAKFEEHSRIWVAADVPLSDPTFLSSKIRDLCGDLPVFWLRPTYTNGGQRKRKAAPHQRRQAPGAEEEVDPEAEFNPENPYHRGLDGDEGTMTFDPMLDHQGVCCTECRRSHTQCQRICEPLGGFQPWPYHYRGCRVACRVIMPCRWWVGRILGIL